MPDYGAGYAMNPSVAKLKLMPVQSYTTQITPSDEQQFQQWVKENKIPWRDEPKADYDMRGYWKAQQQGNPQAQRGENQHFPDTWKTPYHKSFSNESIYAKPDDPHWEGNQLIDKNGKVVFDEAEQEQ